MTRLKLLALSTALIALSGCARSQQVILHPIEKADIQKMPKGQAYAPDRDGWFLSDFYLAEVARARVEEVKK